MDASYIAPAVTLFSPNGALDFDSQGAFYETLIGCGIDGILIQGSIGEFFAMPLFQRMQLARFAIETINHRVPCIVGVSGMIPDEISPYANYCLDLGADAVILLPPWYFSFDAESLFTWFHRFLGEIQGPVWLYNFPARTGSSLDAETVLRLAEAHPNLAGIKDTVPGMDHTRDLIRAIRPRFPGIRIFSGFDDNAAHNVLSGGDGVIGGLSNVVPELCSAWMDAIRKGDWDRIVAGQRRIDRLMELYTIRPVFVPVIKEAARLRGMIPFSACTFPMTAPSGKDRATILSRFPFPSV